MNNQKISIIAVLVAVIGFAVVGIVLIAKLPLSGDSKKTTTKKKDPTMNVVQDPVDEKPGDNGERERIIRTPGGPGKVTITKPA